jgi:hypothetical protein
VLPSELGVKILDRAGRDASLPAMAVEGIGTVELSYDESHLVILKDE